MFHFYSLCSIGVLVSRKIETFWVLDSNHLWSGIDQPVVWHWADFFHFGRQKQTCRRHQQRITRWQSILQVKSSKINWKILFNSWLHNVLTCSSSYDLLPNFELLPNCLDEIGEKNHQLSIIFLTTDFESIFFARRIVNFMWLKKEVRFSWFSRNWCWIAQIWFLQC